MFVWLVSVAFAQSWTVFEGPSAAVRCVGLPEELAREGDPYCPEFENTSLAVSDGGNYLFIWEKGENLTPSGVDAAGVRFRHYDSALGAYSGGQVTMVSGSVGGEGHSPSVDWVPGDPGYFAASRRVLTAADGRVQAEVRLFEAASGDPPTVGSPLLIDPDEVLCPACDHGTCQLFFDAESNRLRWAFTWQHPDGAAYESFDEAYGTWITAGGGAYSSANVTRIEGDFFSPGTSDPAMSCVDLEALDGPSLSADACFDPAGLSLYGAQHHAYWARRAVSNGLIAVWMDWTTTPNSVWAGFYTGLSTKVSMQLSSGSGKAAEAVSTVAEDGYFHAAWKQRNVAEDLFSDLMYRFCTGTNSQCGAALGNGYWVPDNPTTTGTSLYQVNTVDGTAGEIGRRFVEAVGVVSTPPVVAGSPGAVYLAFEVKDHVDPDGSGDLPAKNYSQIFVTSACLDHPLAGPAELVWSGPSAPDPIEGEFDLRTFGSRTFENLVVDPVNERVVVSWIARDYDPDVSAVGSFEVRWAYTPFRDCSS